MNKLELDFGEPDKFILENDNLYASLNYKGSIGKSWVAQVGVSYSENEDIGNIYLEEGLQRVVEEGILDLPELDISSYDNLLQK